MGFLEDTGRTTDGPGPGRETSTSEAGGPPEDYATCCTPDICTCEAGWKALGELIDRLFCCPVGCRCECCEAVGRCACESETCCQPTGEV